MRPTGSAKERAAHAAALDGMAKEGLTQVEQKHSDLFQP